MNMTLDKSFVPRQTRVKTIFDLYIVRFFFLVVILGFFLSSAEAVKIEFDDVNSTSSISMEILVNAGTNSDSNDFQTDDFFC